MTERQLDLAISRQHNLEELAGSKKLEDMSWFNFNRDEITPLQPNLIRAEPYELQEEPILDIIKRKYRQIKDEFYKITGF